jgi:UDPglucose--hexose-1-phosphate uridylyltransferase
MKSPKNSPIEFKREVLPSRIMVNDNSGKPGESIVPLELRYDPLTGQTCRIVQYATERIIRPDMDILQRRSEESLCPFCKPFIDKITPRFPPDLIPEGVIHKGKAMAFPNNNPYDIYGVVVVVSDEHFIPLKDFDAETIYNALHAAQSYLKSVAKFDARAIYHFIAWNYMPPAGGSLVHPHLQSNAGYYPTGYQKVLLEAAEQYFQEKGTNYWSDLLVQERKTRQRYIGKKGNTEWLTGFAPKGRLADVMAVFPGKASVLDLTAKDLHDFTSGLLKVFGYIDRLNLISFNLSTYSGFDRDRFWAHVRITPRGLLLYSPIETSDQFYYQVLQDENICIIPPEEMAAEVRVKF